MVEKIPIVDPLAPLSDADKAVFGHDCRRHEILGFPIEKAEKSLPIEHQVANYLRAVEVDWGKAVADGLRAKLKASEAA